MTSMEAMNFNPGILSKAATLPSCPRKGKVSMAESQKPEAVARRSLWGGYTVEIKYDKDGHVRPRL